MAITLVHDVDIERRPDPTAYEGDFRDTFIEDAGPDAMHDGSQVVIGYSNKVAVERRGLFYFDLKKYIPASATLTAAVWHLYCPVTTVPSNIYHFRLYRLVRTIEERVASWNSYANTDSGTATGGDANTLEDDTKAWGVDALIGYRVTCTPAGGGPRVITDNDATSVDIAPDAWGAGVDAGDPYTICGPWTTAGAFHDGDDHDSAVKIISLTCPNVNDGTGWYAFDIYDNIVSDAWANRDGICTFMGYRIDNLTLTGEFQIQAKNYYDTNPALVHHLRVTYTLAGKTYQAFVFDGDISAEEARRRIFITHN